MTYLSGSRSFKEAQTTGPKNTCCSVGSHQHFKDIKYGQAAKRDF